MKEAIIPAADGWYVVEGVLHETLPKIVDLCKSPIIAWAIKDDGEEVKPILSYGKPSSEYPIIVDPELFYWSFDGSTQDKRVAIAWLQSRWDAEHGKFDRTSEKTVEPSENGGNAGEPGGI